MPLPVGTLKEQQEILYPPNVEYGWVLLIDTTPKVLAFTVNTFGSIFIAPGHDFRTGTRLTFSSTGTLPAPLVAGTIYYVDSIDTLSPNDPFTVTTDGDLDVVTLTTTGTGTHTLTEVLLDDSVSLPISWVRKEVTYEGTMGRKSYTPLDAVEDPANHRAYTPEVSLAFVNDGAASVVFDGAVLLKGGNSTPADDSGTVDLFDIFSSPQTIAPGETRILKIPNIYANG
jgi:hypothetical protein